MKIMSLAIAIAMLNGCTLDACAQAQSDDKGEPWYTPSRGGTAWSSEPPRTNHYQNQICVEVLECSSCVLARRDSIYADGTRLDGAKTLAEIAREVTNDIDYRDAAACAHFHRAVERAVALETDYQLNYKYKPRERQPRVTGEN